MINILIINCGSSSIKYQIIDIDNSSVPAYGLLARIGESRSRLRHRLLNGENNYDEVLEILEVPEESREQMLSRLQFLYGEEQAHTYMPELERVLKVHYAHKPQELIGRECIAC